MKPTTGTAVRTAPQDAMEKYGEFIEHLSEGIFRFVLPAPVAMDRSAHEQVEALLDHAVLAESNHVHARLYGFVDQRTSIGLALERFGGRELNRDALNALIANDYELEREWSEDFAGQRRWFVGALVGIVEGGALHGVWGTQADITQRKLGELVLEGQRDVLERVASNDPLPAIMTFMIETAEAICPGALGSILVLDADGEHLRHGAAPSLPAAYVQAVDGQSIGPEAGSCGTASYHGRRVIVEDIETDPLWRDYRAFALPHGLRACWSEPVIASDGTILGTFAMYQRVVKAPSAHELRVIEMMARLTSIAIARRRAEDEARLLNEELEQRVAERTEALRRANRELEAFSYSVSHDLQAPLRAINGYISILEQELGSRLEPGTSRMFERVRQGSLQMGRLLQDLLRLSRITREPPRLRPVELSALVEEAVHRLHEAEPHRRVDVSVDTADTIQGDGQLLALLINNLVANAWKFTARRKRAQIRFAVAPGEKGPVYSVRDNGVGFDMRYAEKLFQPFQRLHTTAEFEGSGIGLAIAYRVVEQHGGRIWVESTLDIGTTVYFEFGHGARGPPDGEPA